MTLRRTRMIALLAALALVPTLAACSAQPVVDSSSAQSHTKATPAPKATPTQPPIPVACDVMDGQQVADASGVGSFGPATQTTEPNFVSGQDAFGDPVNVTRCVWQYSDKGKAALGIDPDSTGDVEISISAYNHSDFSSGGNGWTDANAQSLAPSYLAANSEQIGSNPVAQMVSDSSVPMVQDGTEVVAASTGTYWFELELFGCYATKCGPNALDLAKALQKAFQ